MYPLCPVAKPLKKSGSSKDTILAAALDLIPVGVIILTPSGRPMLKNRSARELIARSADSSGPLADIRISVVQLCEEAATLEIEDDPSLLLQERIASIERRTTRETSRGHYVAVILRESRRDPVPELIQSQLSLTPSESRIACMLSRGSSVDQIASELGIKKATARTHLRNIYAKTGVRCQADLVRLLLEETDPLGLDLDC